MASERPSGERGVVGGGVAIADRGTSEGRRQEGQMGAGDKRRMTVSMVVVKVYWEQARGSARPTGTTFPIAMWTAPFFGEQSGRGRTLLSTSRKHFQMKKAVVPESLALLADSLWVARVRSRR